MKFIKLESYWKDTSAYLVNVNDITFVVDKKDFREVTANIDGVEQKMIRVKTSLDDIYAAIETSNNTLKDLRKPLYD